MSGKRGSFLAVIGTGEHVAGTGIFKTYDDFKQYACDQLRPWRWNVDKFFYAWGGGSQMYTRDEMLEVFFGE